MTLIKAIPSNRGNFGSPEDNLPVYSRDINPLMEYALRGVNVISSYPNINLKNTGNNTFFWEQNKKASNSAPTKALVKHKSGTYSPINISETLASASFIVNNDILNDFDSIQVQETTTSTVISTIVFNTGDSVDDILAKFTAAMANGFSGSEDTGTDTMTMTAPTGTGTTGNTYNLAIFGRDINGGVFIPIDTFAPGFVTLNNSGEFSGGVSAQATSFSLKIGATELIDFQANSAQDLISQLTNGLVINFTPTTSIGEIFPNTGDYSLPVTIGTSADFIIDVYILGN